jgi:hypothetical protein
MDGDTVWLLVGSGTGAGALFALWAWLRFDVKRPSATRDGEPPAEPCWTEEISTDGRLSCGRYGCYHSDLAEMDARARSGEFSSHG